MGIFKLLGKDEIRELVENVRPSFMSPVKVCARKGMTDVSRHHNVCEQQRYCPAELASGRPVDANELAN